MGSKKVKKKSSSKRGRKVEKSRKFSVKETESHSDIKSQKLHSFSQVRENYFNYLQNVIKENLDSTNNKNVPHESLEKISLEVEQQALLACMQSEIYQRVIIKIIHDIKKSTQQMKLHLGIKNILESKALKDFEISQRLKLEIENLENKTLEKTTVGPMCFHIPTISSVRGNCSRYDTDWSVPSIADEYGSNVCPSNNFDCSTATLRNENENGALSVSPEVQDVMQALYIPSTGENYVPSYNKSPPKYMFSSLTTADKDSNKTTTSETENAYISGNLFSVQPSLFGENYNTNVIKNNSNETITSNKMQTLETYAEGTDAAFQAYFELQKPTNIHLENMREICERKDEEQDRVRIAKILEDNFENDGEDNQYDSLSDNCDEYSGGTYNVRRSENLLADRLEEMRQMFGMQDDGEEKMAKNLKSSEILESGKYMRRQKIQKYNHIWYHERAIQMYKLSLLASETTEDMRKRNRRIFSECFGDDSDEENEMHFLREDKYLLSCKERISSWVVKYLMPFYQKNKIIGRNVFKSLGQHISSSIIEQIQYPDEWTVKYMLNKFFPTDKIFADESDVTFFQIEL